MYAYQTVSSQDLTAVIVLWRGLITLTLDFMFFIHKSLIVLHDLYSLRLLLVLLAALVMISKCQR